jgi:hypothetical protein
MKNAVFWDVTPRGSCKDSFLFFYLEENSVILHYRNHSVKVS